MTIVQRGSSFQVSVGSGKDRFRATAPTRALAEAIEKKEIEKRFKEKLGVIEERSEKPKVDVTLGRLYELAKRRTWLNKGESQARNAGLILKLLGERTSVHDVNRERIHELIDELYEQGNSGATINRKMSSLRVLLDIAEEEEWIERAPKIPAQNESKHRIRFFNDAEETEMLKICTKFGMHELADFIAVAIDTGFRRSEILGLSVRDCENDMAVLHAGTTKSGHARSVPLTSRVVEIVKRRKDLGYTKLFEDMSDAQLRKRWDMLRENYTGAGEHFIVHTLRHTCASRLAITGHNAVFIKEWMGHSTIMVTQRYMHLAPDTLKGGVVSLEDYRKKVA